MRQLLIAAALFMAMGLGLANYAERAMDSSRAPETAAKAVAEPRASGRTVLIPRDRRGHFSVQGRVDGKAMNFTVDTGASAVTLTARDAARLGIHPMPRDFNADLQTANGIVRAATTRLARVEIDDVIVRDVVAVVVPDQALNENLLGLSFLSKLRRFEYANGKLVLEQ